MELPKCRYAEFTKEQCYFAMTEHWAEDLQAAQNAPDKPYLTDEYKAVDKNLWDMVMQVAKGERRYLTRGGPNGERTINAPNNGQGFHKWPSQKAVAWAIKQYKGFGGQWKGDDEKQAADVHTEAMRHYQRRVLDFMRTGSLITTATGTDDHSWMLDLQDQHLVNQVHVADGNHVCDITAEGVRVFVAGLEHDLTQKMDHLLGTEPYSAADAKKVGEWFEANFRFKSPKTPNGQKELKAKCESMHWALVNGGFVYRGQEDAYKFSVIENWAYVKLHLGDLVKYFSDEGGKIVPNELKIGSNTYLNKAGLDEKTLEKYAHRLNTVIESLRGWRAKALKGGVKVMLVSPRDLATGGKYKVSEDTLMVRATPVILKRDAGTYASFDYIVIHEMGHRYEYKNSVPQDFDNPQWYTSKYSYKEGETFAELFAIGHYDMKGPWDQAVVEKFEKVMA